MSEHGTDGAIQNTQPATDLTDPTPVKPAIRTVDDVPQDIRNQIEAANKRGLQQQLRDTTAQLQQMQTLRDQVSSLMEGLNVPAGSDLDDVASQINGTLESLKSEKEKIEAANKKQAKDLETARKAADDNLKLYHDTLIRNDILRGLGDKPVPGKAGDTLTRELEQYAAVQPDGTVAYNMDVTDENGHTAKQAIGIEKAVALLESNVKDWGFAFKSTVNSGAGGEVVDGVQRTQAGQVDMEELTKNPKKFFELMEKNPGLIEAAYAQVR